MSFMRRRKLSKSLRQLNNSSVVYGERNAKSEIEVGAEVDKSPITIEDPLVQRPSCEEDEQDETSGLFVLLFLSVCVSLQFSKCELALVMV